VSGYGLQNVEPTRRMTSARVNSLVTGGGMLLQQALGFIGGVFVAKLLGPADYGEVSVLRTLLALIIVFTPLGLDLALFRILPRFDAEPAVQALHFRRFRMIVLGFGIVLAAVGGLVAGPLLARGVYHYHGFALDFAITLLAVPLATDVLLMNAWYRVQGNIVPILLMTNYFQPIVRTGLNVLAVYLGYGVIGVVVGTTIAYLVTLLIALPYFAWTRRGQQPVTGEIPGWYASWQQFSEAPPMALNLFAGNIMRTADLVIVGAIAVPHAVGEYAVVSNISQLVPVAAMSLTQTLGPTVARCFQRNDNAGIAREINQVISLASILASFVMGGIAGFGVHLDAVFGAAYQPSQLLVLIIPLGYLLSATLSPAGYALSMCGHAGLELAILGGSAALLVASCVPLTWEFGTPGAAIAVLLAYATGNVIRFLTVRRLLGEHLGHWRDLMPPVVALTIGVAVNHAMLPQRAKFGQLFIACVFYSLIYGGTMFGRQVYAWLRTRRVGAIA